MTHSMLSKKALKLLTLVTMLSAASPSSAENTQDDYDAIKITIQNYFEGFKYGDRARLEKAFAVAHAHMKGYTKNKEGQLVVSSRPMNDVIDDWVSREPSPDFKGEILSVNIFSDVAALATFDFNGIYTDAFQLAKIDGEWRIVNKFYVNQ